MQGELRTGHEEEGLEEGGAGQGTEAGREARPRTKQPPGLWVTWDQVWRLERGYCFCWLLRSLLLLDFAQLCVRTTLILKMSLVFS